MRVLRAGALYFAIVFGVGFLLGPIRILWIVPRVGTRTAELIEAPIHARGQRIRGAMGGSLVDDTADVFCSAWHAFTCTCPHVGC